MKMQLPLKQRLKLLRQSFYARLNFRGHLAVSINEDGDAFLVSVDGQNISVPSPLRWKLYKYGWEKRLDRLEKEYGIGRHVKLKPNAVVLDIGSNAGEFAFVCARYGAAVHCFEPDPTVFSCLKRNVSSLKNVSVHDIALWKEDGLISFGLAPERADSSVFHQGAKKIQKPAVSIETFCRQNNIEKIDFIKCDAEGAEPEILEGIGSMFPYIDALALDTGAERNGMRTHEACAALLKANNFTVIEEKIGTRWMTYGVKKTLDGNI